MVIIEDTRQQKSKHDLKHKRFEELGDKLVRSKIPVGDYCKFPAVSVDTKAGLEEIAGNIGGKEHQRFINECKLAQEHGCELYVLVENTESIDSVADVERWQNPRTAVSPNCIQGPRLARAMRTIEERYGCMFLFCRPEEAADCIEDLLREPLVEP